MAPYSHPHSSPGQPFEKRGTCLGNAWDMRKYALEMREIIQENTIQQTTEHMQ